jgi:hypothetical protein
MARIAHATALPSNQHGSHSSTEFIVDDNVYRQSEDARARKVDWGNPEGGGFAEQFDEHECPVFTIGHLVDGLESFERPGIDSDSIPWGKQALRMLLLECATGLQGFHHSVLHMGGLIAESDQTAHTSGGPERCPTLSRQVLSKTYEQVTRKQGFLYDYHPAAVNFFCGEQGQYIFISLLQAILMSHFFLPWPGM